MTRYATLTVLLIVTAFGLSSETSANMAPPVHEFRVGLTLEKAGEGLRIASVDKGGAADRATAKLSDVVLAIDGRYWKAFSNADLKSFVNDNHTWPVSMIVLRKDGETVETVLLEP